MIYSKILKITHWTWFFCNVLFFLSCGKIKDSLRADIFSDMTTKLKIQFHHEAGNNDEYHMPESIGSGVAIFDSNNDGLVDIYFLNGYKHKKNTLSSNELFVQTNENTFPPQTHCSMINWSK